jgi:hypothetical protein
LRTSSAASSLLGWLCTVPSLPWCALFNCDRLCTSVSVGMWPSAGRSSQYCLTLCQSLSSKILEAQERH